MYVIYTSYMIFQLRERVANGMSVFIIWIYNVDVKDLQKILDRYEMVLA